ncbi:hypothetical protein AOR13_2624 [Alteromonas stellipolaris LMG 21856]|nr:hypothetical protein AOR13_2624 [Alteromonas stellipolaris LMG 21856]
MDKSISFESAIVSYDVSGQYMNRQNLSLQFEVLTPIQY